MKTSELSGAALNWAVAIADGWTVTTASDKEGQYLWLVCGISEMKLSQYRPSTNWMRGGPIIEREKLWLEPINGGEQWWSVTLSGNHEGEGATPLIAAMRCYVASKLGDEVQIPEGV